MNRSTPLRTGLVLIALLAGGAFLAQVLRDGERGPELPSSASPTGAATARDTASELDAAPAQAPAVDEPSAAPAPAAARAAARPPAEKARAADLLVRTGTGAWNRLTPAPHVAFELHRAGAALGDPPLFRGRTDARGECAIELVGARDPGLDARELPALFGRVLEPGHQQRTERSSPLRLGTTRAMEGTDPPWQVVLIVEPGSTLRGRIVDEAGEGVSASLSLLPWTQGERGLVLGSAPLGRVRSDGYFELDLEPTVSAGPEADGEVLYADAGERGTASLRGPQIDRAYPPQDLVLVVRGAGVVRGCVRDAQGAPAAGVDLLVRLATLDDGAQLAPSNDALAAALKAEGLGHTSRWTSTDAGGGFEVTGLRAGSFVVRAESVRRSSEYPELLTPRPVPADGVPLELELTQPHVVVRLFEADGSPWSGPGPPGGRELGASFGDEWPDRPVPLALPLDPASGLPLREPTDYEREPLSRHEYRFDLTAGETYLAGVVGGPFRTPFERIEVAPGSGRYLVACTALEEPALADLTVHLFLDGVEAGTGSGNASRFSLTLERAEDGVPLLTRPESFTAPPFHFRGPAGRYRIVAAGTHRTGFHGEVLWPRTLGRAETVVELAAGGNHAVELDLPRGAQLAVTLEGEPGEADREAVDAEVRADSTAERAELVEGLARSATLHLEAPARRPEPLLQMESSSPLAQSLFARWRLGQTRTSAVVPGGTWTLVGRLPGGREARAKVELRAGETTAVVLRF